MGLQQKTRAERPESSGPTPRWSNSLFVRFFLALIALALIPTALVTLFTVAAYQTVLRGVVAQEALGQFTENLAAQAILIFLFVMVMALFVAFILSRNITRPLRTLTGAVERITGGDLKLAFRVTRKDEIGVLAHFFNDMILRLKKIAERQRTISRMKSEFVSITAHQLRSPLSAMKWSLHMLLEGDMGEIKQKQRDTLKRTYKENERMIRLVNDLLNVTRIEEGRFGYTFGIVRINDFLEELIGEYTLSAQQKKMGLHLRLPAKQHNVYVDRERLRLAIGNIIENAIAYTPEGKHVTVTLSEKDDDFLRLSIQDEGLGIREQDHSRVFTKFFRGANVVRRETSGTGLGLFLAKNIIKQHGGDIWFESEEGKGTTFFLTLPLRKGLVSKKENAAQATSEWL